MSLAPASRIRPLRHELTRLVVLGLLPLLLFGVFNIWQALDRQAEGLQRSALELSRALASAVENQLDNVIRNLQTVGDTRLLLRGDIEGFEDSVRVQVGAHPHWLGVVLTDASGRTLFKTAAPRGAPPGPVVDADSLQTCVRTGQPVVGRLLAGRRGLYALAVRVPVIVDQKVAYVLSAVVKPDGFVDLMRKQEAPPGWILSVFDAADRRVARSLNQEGTVGQQPSPSLTALLSRPEEAGVGTTYSVEGEPVYTGYTRLRRFGWTVAVGVPTVTTTTALWHSAGAYLLGLLLSAVLFGALGLRIARRVAGDVGHIRDQARRLGAGEAFERQHSPIAEIDEMESALQAASERLRSANQAKDQFMAMLGHELRNPLAPMLTALHLLDKKAGELGLRERQIMRRQLDHMRRLVDDLLDVSRVERGTFHIRHEPANFTLAVERAVETVQPVFASQGRVLQVQMPDAPLWVVGDETRLVQAVVNLLTNALRFGGEAPVQLNLRAVDQQACLAVEDRGTGIEPGRLSQIFQPFYQTPQSLARTAGGLGLGLAIVKAIVEHHGGRVQVHSDGLGLGSRFEFTLPTIERPPERPAAAPARAPRRPGRVLVVDDNVDAAMTLAQVLGQAGHEVRVAATGQEGLAVARSFAPQVAVLDIGLPDLDGYALALRLRDEPATRHACLVALTGYGQSVDKARARDAGFQRHFTKPADLEHLLEAIDELVAERSEA